MLPIERHAHDPAETWKEYDQNDITHSAAHHLMAIDEQLTKLGYARVSDVARQLNITRGSVSISLQPLKRVGLVVQDENRHLRLSARGQALVNAIKTKRIVVQRLLTEVLGVAAEQAEIDACKIEHLVSHDAARRMLSFLRYCDSGDARARDFLRGWSEFDPSCAARPTPCAGCETGCLADNVGPRK